MSEYIRPEGELTIVLTPNILAYVADIEGRDRPFGVGVDYHSALGELVMNDPSLFGVILKFPDGDPRKKEKS